MNIGIAGTGAIGLKVALFLDRGDVPGFQLAGFCARTEERAAEFKAKLSSPVPHFALSDIAHHCDIVLECLPPHLFETLARPVLLAGKTLIVMSASQLLGRDDLLQLANETGARIIVPSGAMLGVDALKAVAVGELKSVTIKTSKPVAGLLNSAYFKKAGVDPKAIENPYCLLSGSVTDVAKEFPANVNVAAAISLAGLGPDHTRMEIWADPSLKINQHTVSVESDSSNFTVTIQNRPSEENPATGRIAAQSVIALLRQMTRSLKIGT